MPRQDDVLNMVMRMMQLKRGMGGQPPGAPPSTTVQDVPDYGAQPDLSAPPDPMRDALDDDGGDPTRVSTSLRERRPGDATGRLADTLRPLGMPVDQLSQLFSRIRSAL